MKKYYMERAITLGLKGWGQTSPNPMVGALVVKNGRVVGEGYHAKAGAPHAEVVALRRAGKKARGADLYVNLEPCCHFGKTPPCTDAIVSAGIKRVFYGMKDPNPTVFGKGISALKKAGVKVVGPVLEDPCLKLNRPFVKWAKTGLPYVTLKIAITLDGKIADKNMDSKWISNDSARGYAHWMRAGSDVVMVGRKSTDKDSPRLNVRIKGYKGKQPLPMVVGGAKHVDLSRLMRELGGAGFQSILVEGGGLLHSSLLKEGLVDYMVVIIAPKMLGGKAIPWLTDIGNTTIKKPLVLEEENVFTLGDNVIVEGRVRSF